MEHSGPRHMLSWTSRHHPSQKHRSRYSGSRRRKQEWRGSAALPGAESKPRICTRAWVPTTTPVAPPPRALRTVTTQPWVPSCQSALRKWPDVIPNQGPLFLHLSFPISNKEKTTQSPSWRCCGVRGGGGHQPGVQSQREARVREGWGGWSVPGSCQSSAEAPTPATPPCWDQKRCWVRLFCSLEAALWI